MPTATAVRARAPRVPAGRLAAAARHRRRRCRCTPPRWASACWPSPRRRRPRCGELDLAPLDGSHLHRRARRSTSTSRWPGSAGGRARWGSTTSGVGGAAAPDPAGGGLVVGGDRRSSGRSRSCSGRRRAPAPAAGRASCWPPRESPSGTAVSRMTERVIAAIDQGTDVHPLHPVRPRRPDARCRPTRAPADATRGPGWVEHDAAEIWRNVRRVVPEALRAAGLTARRGRRARHRQPARDHRGLGPAHRPSARPARSPGRTPAPTGVVADLADAAARRSPRCPGCRWPPTSPRPGCAGCWTTSPGLRAAAERGRRAVRDHGDLADLEPHRRPNGGVHVTDVTNASRTMLMDLAHPVLVGQAAGGLRHPAADAAGDPRQRRGLRHVHRRAAGGADRGRARRPAGRAVRPDLLRARRGQVHLRHRRVPADQHRRRPAVLDPRADPDGRLPDRRRRRSTPWRGRSRSPARSSSGCATPSG